MITKYTQPFTKEESIGSLNHIIRDWFVSKYKSLTPPQYFSFKLIREGKSMLITAPTGSGKTFSAFMGVLSELFDMAEANKLEDKVYCLYISPLRALNNDIYRNLSEPLNDIYGAIGDSVQRINIGIRTGDTPTSERQKQLAKPPHILVTTPESLAILLNASKFVEKLKDIKYVVVDELHELANNKRGIHLSLSLERLANFVGHDFVRIGLGATLSPLDEAAKFLVGYSDEANERDCIVVDATWDKKLSFETICPVKNIINTPDDKIEKSTYGIINRIIKSNKTTLIFTNTRSGTERVVFNLMKKFKYKESEIAAHHGSLSREIRLGVEETLKKGGFKCVVSSTSLELGIDIGFIDNVVQLGSPKSITKAIQRIGRSGHKFNDTAKGEIIVVNRDDLVECSVMLDDAKKRKLDSFTMPKNPLDVLAQHIVGMSLVKKWKIDEAFGVVKKAYPYHTLQYSDFISVVEYLAGGYVGLESRRVYGKIWYDEETREFGRRGRFTRLIYYLNLGTIPDEVGIDVYTTDGKWIGGIEEEFLSRLKPRDIFVLGGKLYMFIRSSGSRCIVTRAESNTPTIPPWFSEQLPLSYELAISIGEFRKNFSEAIRSDIGSMRIGRTTLGLLKKGMLRPGKRAREMLDSMPMDENARNSIYNYFLEQMLFAKYVPNDRFVLIERTKMRDKSGIKNLVVFHTLYGRRVNDALSRIFAILVNEEYDIDVGVMISDNGFVVVTDDKSELGKAEIESILQKLNSTDVTSLLKRNIRRTELMKRRFRHCAVRSFMVLRNYKGKKISVNKQQINSQRILEAAEEISPNFPVIKETYREILEDVMDLPRAKAIIKMIGAGEIKYKIIELPVPSPFSHNMITFGEADIIMMKDRRKHLKELHDEVIKRIKA